MTTTTSLKGMTLPSRTEVKQRTLDIFFKCVPPDQKLLAKALKQVKGWSFHMLNAEQQEKSSGLVWVVRIAIPEKAKAEWHLQHVGSRVAKIVSEKLDLRYKDSAA